MWFTVIENPVPQNTFYVRYYPDKTYGADKDF